VDLNHVNLRVRDAEACRDFYIQHFGFKPAFEEGGGFFVKNDAGFLLALVPADPHTTLPEGFTSDSRAPMRTRCSRATPRCRPPA